MWYNIVIIAKIKYGNKNDKFKFFFKNLELNKKVLLFFFDIFFGCAWLYNTPFKKM